MTEKEDLAELSKRVKSGIRPIEGRKVRDVAPLPTVVPQAGAKLSKEERRQGRRGRRKTDLDPSLLQAPPVLLATADESLSRMLGFALEQMHLEFRQLSSGSQTLQHLTEMDVGVQPPVVVLDVDLPGMDGHAILERIGVLRPDTFFILVLSSHADESMQVRSLLAGAVDHLAKPFNVRVLMAKLHRWVAMSARLSAQAE